MSTTLAAVVDVNTNEPDGQRNGDGQDDDDLEDCVDDSKKVGEDGNESGEDLHDED